MNDKILIAYGFHKSGHYVTATHLADYLSNEGMQVEILDVWKNRSDLTTRIMRIFKDVQKEKFPFYPDFFLQTDFVDAICREAKLSVDVDEYTGIVSTHPFTSYLLADSINTEVPIIDVHTDFTPSPIVVHDRIDYFLTPFIHSNIRSSVYRRSIPATIPVRRSNAPKGNGILIMGGAEGFGAIEEVCDWLNPMELEHPVTVVCGRNAALYDKLKHRSDIVVKGYVGDIDELLDNNLYVITKASGITVSEALTNGRIPVLYPSLVPWEDEASVILSGRGLGYRIHDFTSSERGRLCEFLSKEEQSEQIKSNYASLGLIEAEEAIMNILNGVSLERDVPKSYQERLLLELRGSQAHSIRTKDAIMRKVGDWINE